MAEEITEAGRIQHGIARTTRSAIAWTGAIQALVGFLTLAWTVWWAWREKGEEKRRRERADKEDARRRERMDEEDVKRAEMAERRVDERVNAAAKQFEDLLTTIRKDHIDLRREINATKVDSERLLTLETEKHKFEIQVKDVEIEDLESQIANLRRRLDSSLGWAPGGSGENRL